MEVIMSSPVQEPSRMELTTSKKKNRRPKWNQRRRAKEKEKVYKSLAKEYENKQQLDQTHPNNSLTTTATVDQKQEVSSSEKMISDDIAPVSKKRKRPKKKKKKNNTTSSDIQSVVESTQTQDMVTINKDSSETSGGIAGSSGGVKLNRTQKNNLRQRKKRKMYKFIAKNIINKQQLDKKQEESSPAATGADTVSKGEDDTKVANYETDDNNTVSKKSPLSGDIQSVYNYSQILVDIVTLLNKDSSTSANDDAKPVSKGEEDTKVANGEIGSGTSKKKNNPSSMAIQSVHDTGHGNSNKQW